MIAWRVFAVAALVACANARGGEGEKPDDARASDTSSVLEIDAAIVPDGTPIPPDAATTCKPLGTACSGGSQCCSHDCNGTCIATTCQADHTSCFAHAECCDGPCMGGYCNGPEVQGTCAIEGVSCWSHGQCCSKLCNPEGYCISPRPQPCVADGGGCVFNNGCCSGTCKPVSSTCAISTPGGWLP